jgi:asparagine synthase (glutamine-hydrolysing)
MRKEQLKSLPVLAEQPMRWFYMGVWYYFDDDTKRKRIFASSNDEVDTGQILQELHNESGASDIRNAIAYVDFKTQLADEFLFFTDRLSMAHSLEARVPYLDHEFVELAMRIPSQIRSKQTDWKHLLKKAIGPLIPSEILNARKRGFVIPIKLWLRSELKPLADRLLSPERLKAQGIFHPGFYENFVAPHQRGQDYTWQIWAMLMFQLWHVVFVESGASTRPSFDWRDLV